MMHPLKTTSSQDIPFDQEVFDCTNITESYPGITLPLTYSFIRVAYAHVYQSFLRLVGVPDATITAQASTLQNLLGYINGRVYYRIHNWYNMLALLPGYHLNKDFFESMLVPQENLAREEDILLKQRPFSFLNLFTKIKLSFRFLSHLFFYKQASQKFLTTFQTVYSNHQERNLRALTPNQIIASYQNLCTTLFSDWKTPILNDFRVMIFYGILTKIITKLHPEKSDFLLNQLLSGFIEQNDLRILTDLESLSSLIYSDPLLLAYIQENTPEQILATLDTHPKLNHAVCNYLALYGSRRPGELKLENLSLSEDPTTLIHTLKQVLKTEKPSFDNHSTSIKKNDVLLLVLENQAPIKKFFLSYVISFISKYARIAIRQRELFRFKRGQAFKIARDHFTALGQKMTALGVIVEEEDIFYLTTEEVFSMVNNDSFEPDYLELIAARKKRYQLYQANTSPQRRLCRIGFGTKATDSSSEKAVSLEFNGKAASAGKVTGEALVVQQFDSRADYSEKILITHYTDPGWTIIFPLLKGIVLEKGNILSHGAILSRELGIPCIVKVDHITETIKTGDILELDGTEGTLKIITRHASTP